MKKGTNIDKDLERFDQRLEEMGIRIKDAETFPELEPWFFVRVMY